MEMTDLLRMTVEAKASDLLLTVGVPPVLKVDGQLMKTDLGRLSPKDTSRLIHSILSESQKKGLEETHELDFTYDVPGLSRFRVNAYFQRNSLAAAFRIIPRQVPTLEGLCLPKTIAEFCMLDAGLVLVTGPAAAGKSTTLAAMIDVINVERNLHVMTLESPIEFLHVHKKGVVEQREVGRDTASFETGLGYAYRQNPDVILIGEMQNLDTISGALSAAETGHLVLATLHTARAIQTIDRTISVFPPSQQQQVRYQLSITLQGVISQQLLPKLGGGQIPACEILFVTPPIRTLIRDDNVSQIEALVETGGRLGMQSMDQALLRLYREEKIAKDVLVGRISDPDRVRGLL